MGLHSALAIKRQRKRRDEQRRARERRYSAQSGESGLTSPRASTGSLDHHHRHNNQNSHVHRAAGEGVLDSKVVTSIGMLHIGVVFLVLGGFLLASGLLPGDFASWGTKATGGWWNELVATGIFAVVMGVFLIILNKIIAKKEEDDLEEYVQRQLTRSRSGHRLERDVETGGLTTRHARRAKQMKAAASAGAISSLDESEPQVSGSSPPPPRSPPPAYSPQIMNDLDNLHPVQSNLAPGHLLEQITEEDLGTERIETVETGDDFIYDGGSQCEIREIIHSTSNDRFYINGGNHPKVHRPLYVHVSRI